MLLALGLLVLGLDASSELKLEPQHRDHHYLHRTLQAHHRELHLHRTLGEDHTMPVELRNCGFTQFVGKVAVGSPPQVI